MRVHISAEAPEPSRQHEECFTAQEKDILIPRLLWQGSPWPQRHDALFIVWRDLFAHNDVQFREWCQAFQETNTDRHDWEGIYEMLYRNHLAQVASDRSPQAQWTVPLWLRYSLWFRLGASHLADFVACVLDIADVLDGETCLDFNPNEMPKALRDLDVPEIYYRLSLRRVKNLLLPVAATDADGNEYVYFREYLARAVVTYILASLIARQIDQRDRLVLDPWGEIKCEIEMVRMIGVVLATERTHPQLDERIWCETRGENISSKEQEEKMPEDEEDGGVPLDSDLLIPVLG